MQKQKESVNFATDIINEAVKQRNRWRLAFCISLVGNIILVAMIFM